MKYPHPKVWLVVMLIFSGLFFLNLQLKEEIRSYFNGVRFNYLFNKQAKGKGDVKVVLLCSSLGKQAISDPSTLNNRMQEIDSNSFEFVKLPIAAATLEDFTGNQLLLDRLKTYNPDYLLIQESFLLVDRIKDVNSFSLRNTISFQNIKEMTLRSPDVMERGIKNKNTLNVYSDSLTRSSHFLTRRSNIRSFSSLEAFSNLNSELLVFEIPLPSFLETVMDSIRQSDQYREVYTTTKKLSNFRYIKYPYSHPFSHYYDESHMNDIGEQIFTTWFLKKISEIHKES